MTIKTIFYFLIITCYFSESSLASSVQTNFEVLKSLSRQKIEPCLQKNLTNHHLPVQILNIDSADSTGWFFEAVIFDILQNLQIESIQAGQQEHSDSLRSQQFSGYQISYQKIDLKLNYKTPEKWTFWFPKTFKREATVKLFIKIQEITAGKNQLLWSGILENNSIDEISTGELKKIEYSQLAFTRAEVPNISIYHHLIEPIIIIGSAGWIIYLFYSFRSR